MICGQNGQGKTNIIEGIYWLSTLKPLRTTRVRELVRWGQPTVHVSGTIESEGLTHRLAVELKEGSRQSFRENKKMRARNYFGVFATVLFTPEDVGLIRGAPEKRRRLLDRAIFTSRPTHLEDFLNYRRALDARNQLLRDRSPDELIDVYEETLAQYATKLISSRRAYIDRIRPKYQENLAAILGPELDNMLRYKPSIQAPDESLFDKLRETWRDDRSRDRERGFTTRGPHADDIVFSILGHSARSYASQGQQRSMVLSLKIAEIQLFQEIRDEIPIVLLDDVSSELDADRNERLFDFLDGFLGQVFITTTDPAFLRIQADRKDWHVTSGTVKAVES